MKVLFACVCDHALADQNGKLSVHGIFDRINASTFPTVHSKMFLVFRLMMEYEDNDKPHMLKVSLVDQDGGTLFQVDASIQQQERLLPGAFGTGNQILEFSQLVITHPGRYVFVVEADGETGFQVPFDVVQQA